MKRYFPCLALLLCLCSFTASASASVRTVLNGPDAPAVPGEEVRIEALFLNPTAGEAEYTAPTDLPCSLSWGGRTLKATLRSDFADLHGTLPASGFASTGYVLRLPAAVSGTVEVRLEDGERLVLLTAADDSVATGGPVPEGAGGRSQGSETDGAVGGRGASQTDAGQSKGNPLATGKSFTENFSLHEPMYFIYGGNDPASARFQLSFKYQLLNERVAFVENWRWLTGIHFGYTQTSLWDWESDSAPFIDSSYKPEFFWLDEDMDWAHSVGWVDRFGVQAGVQHESNGRDGSASRSMNFVYAKPMFGYELPRDWYLRVAPKLLTYIGDLSDNQDLAEYRGYGDLNVKLGQEDGWELAVTTHMFGELDKNSYQFDVTYPLNELVDDLDVYLHAQYFTGYGMSLLNYDKREDAFRIGFAVSR